MDHNVTRLRGLVDLITPMAIRVAATLRLADRIAAGTTTLTELAADVDADPDALGRLLRYLAARGVFAEPEPGRFALTESAELLRDDHPDKLRTPLDLTGAWGRVALAFGALLDVVRTGKPGYPIVHGRDFWADLAGDSGLTASFDAVMTGSLARRAPWSTAQDWSGTQHVVDVGGGTATLLIALLQAHPHLHGTLIELPATAVAAKRALAEAGLSGRCDVVAGSFFDPLPADADVYLLNSIVHNWNDTDATSILRRCAQAAGPKGRVLLGEHIATEDQDRQTFTRMDLLMLVLFSGKERTLEDLAVLANTAGLTITSVTAAESEWGNSLIDCTVL